MKLLLTSAGFRNESIIAALKELLDKPLEEAKLAFVPTDANAAEGGDKGWLIDDLCNCKKLGFAEVDIVDISAIPRDMWEPRLKNAHVLLFGGGNTFHLMYWLEKSGLNTLLPELLKSRVYVGISAGSMVTASSLMLSTSSKIYSEEIGELKNTDQGLKFVNFQIRPHFNLPAFPKANAENLAKEATKTTDEIYGIDDETAIKVVESKVEVISEGKWQKFN